jgi:predicted alpha/beta hydrolase
VSDRVPVAEPVAFAAADGYRLAGVLYHDGPLNAECVSVVNCGAGIPAAYYSKFATFVASAGIPTLIYDYRGVGHSRPASLRNFDASVEEWGSKDCAAAVHWMRSTFSHANVHVIAHSIGCFLLGFMQEPKLVDAVTFIGAHTGYYGDYSRAKRWPMWLAWHCLMPGVTRATGYFPGRRLGLPADLPRTVALEWAQRRRPDFWWNLRNASGGLDEARVRDLRQRFASFVCPGLMLEISDDAFATGAGSARIASLFRNIAFRTAIIDARATARRRIGHFGFFAGRSRPHWTRIVDWINAAPRARLP